MKNSFSAENARRIAIQLRRVHPVFSVPAFCDGLENALRPLELKQRMQLIADRIEANLPTDPPRLFALLVASLVKDESDAEGLRGFAVWPLTEIVARRGLDHFDEAMTALRAMTRCFTAEFASRPFLLHQPQRTLRQLKKWCRDPDENVRRLVSEGSRPLLPWGERLPQIMANPSLTLPLLELLHHDESAFVRLSVSNHLNDFSKVHPDLVIDTLVKWRSAKAADAHFDKLARHACRTLIKQGHPRALALQGFGAADALEITPPVITPTVKLGGHLDYRFTIRNTSSQPQRVLFDYAIWHRKANGSLTAKVFKGSIKELAADESWDIQGRHPLKPITTRTYYPGVHGFEPRLNGKAFPTHDFLLKI
jgi:3-methyladenine DNA glycosylase AlkC